MCTQGGPHDTIAILTPLLPGHTVIDSLLMMSKDGGGTWKPMGNANGGDAHVQLWGSSLYKMILLTAAGLASQCEIFVVPEDCGGY